MGNRKLFDEKSALELLEEFRVSGSNEPFEEIVRRYAAMVFGVCLRVTGDKHDAEDATQAVFLSLALQAKTSRQITYVGPWLQKVAHRLALDTRKSKGRRKRREEKLVEEARHANGNGRNYGLVSGGAFGGGNGHLKNPADAPGAEELKTIMMEELNQLPAKYRLPLVMHYFGGLSREQMAEQLGCNPSTLGVRVHRGKAMLGSRLAKRGVAISAVVLGVMLEHIVRDGTLGPIISGSTAAGNGLVAGHGMGVAVASAKVAQIIRSTARAVVYAKFRYAMVIVLIVSSAAIAMGGNVVQQIKSHLPSINLSGWIKPLLRAITPDLQANSGDAGADDPAEVVSPSSHDLKLNVDAEHVGMAPLALNARPSSSDYVATPKSQVATDHTNAIPSQNTNTLVMNDLAAAILSPPILFPARHNTPDNSIDLPLGTNAKMLPQDLVAATNQPVVASGGSFTLGAGGGGGGKADVYVMPVNAVLHNQSMTIGDGGVGVFHQVGGVNTVDGTLTLGRQKDSTGVYQFDGGTLTANNEIIGDAGDGTFIQTSGVNVANESVVVGNSGSGTYDQSGGTLAVKWKPTKSTSTSASPSGLLLATSVGSQGTLNLAEGSVNADPQQIGVVGVGKVVQTGGSNSTGSIQLAIQPGSTGSYVLDGGTLTFYPRGNPTSVADAAINVGGRGHGVFYFGGENSTGAVYEVGQFGASVVVRGTPTASGSIEGYGKLNLTGVLVNNGQIIADGKKNNRTLDLSSFTSVTSSIENPRWGGTNGWFARKRGELILPKIPVQAGTNTYTWGEDPGDPMIDLVNSVRFSVENAKNAGDVSIALMSTIRTDIPTLPEGHHFIGVWSFDGSDLGGFDGVNLQVRYDDAAAASLGLDENILKLWWYNPTDSAWHRIMDDTFSRDTIDHILTGYAPGELTYFAVSAPEPAGAMILLIAGGLALRRRRRAR